MNLKTTYITLGFKKLKPNAKIPFQAHKTDAGYDLFASADIVIKSGGVGKIKTDIACQFPEKFWGKIEGRSSLASKNIFPIGGIIDNGYTGELSVNLKNDSGRDIVIVAGNKIAQLIIYPLLDVKVVEITELQSTDRNDKGFGSTGF